MPLIMFYPKHNQTTNEEQTQKIKNSLSQALTIFYPLAGRIKENSYVDCNDEGLYFVQAKANCTLSDILHRQDPEDSNNFIPIELDEGADELPAIVQLTFFLCGGLAVFFGMSHKVGDALAIFMFINCLATILRGENEVTTLPRFDSANMFPPKNISSFQPRTGIVKANIAIKRFVFDASAIATLREKYDVDGCRPTRVEALSALIFSRFMAATSTLQPDESNHVLNQGSGREKHHICKSTSSECDNSLPADISESAGSERDNNISVDISRPAGSQRDSDTPTEKIYTVIHAVNLRPRMDSSSSQYDFMFGNLSRPAFAQPWTMAGEINPHEIVKRIKEAISKVDSDYIKVLQENDNYVHFLRNAASSFVKGEMVSFAFTSLCRFPVYEADFGWGKPVWVGSARLTFKNLVTFFDTNNGDGIEAWINLDEEDMTKFEIDEELLSYVSLSENSNLKYY